MHSRSTFYPLPPSAYPKPLIDPCPSLETTYGHEHGAHSLSDVEHYRSRTLNDGIRAATAPIPRGGFANIYPKHGIGQFTLPYYRRDSKGFRATYTQPQWVDQNYLRDSEHRHCGLVNTGSSWCHPSSRPVYATRTGVVGGQTLGTSYRNSGLYDSRINVKPSTVPFEVYNKITGRDSINDTIYYEKEDGQVLDQRELQSERQREVFGDPLKSNPLENAYRKSRTVYKRAYGLST